MSRSLLASPVALAVLITLVNAVKPVVVDDTAYLAYARHIAGHPLDPYGFEVYWYDDLDPAMTVLAPPVLPYWLAAGIGCLGEHVFLLKLWLFPLAWLLTGSLAGLLRRFSRGIAPTALPLIVLSPAVLCTLNLMLDIPALALGLASLRVFAASCDRRSWWLAAGAGLLAALAMQTKYTMLLAPAVLGWYGLTHRSVRLAILSMAIAVAGFVGWEVALTLKYGQSHFVYSVTYKQQQAEQDGWGEYLDEKANLAPALAGHLGCLAAGFGLFAGRAVGFPRTWVVVAAVFWVVGVLLVAVLPYHDAILIPGKEPGREKLTLATVVWRTTGTATLLTAAGCAVALLVRSRNPLRLRWNADSFFVVGWVLLEMAGYFALTPFPAARRVISVSVTIGVLAARAVSRVSRTRPDRRPPGWVLPLAVGMSGLVAAIATFDAWPEPVLAERAATAVRDREPGSTAWFAGHWGFQYSCERAGLRPLLKHGTVVEPGDYLVLPVFPDEGFFRPDSIHIPPPPPAEAVQRVEEFVWLDWLSAQTIPNFYGGVEPIIGRDYPRFRVAVYRVTRPCALEDGVWVVEGRRPARVLDILRGG